MKKVIIILMFVVAFAFTSTPASASYFVPQEKGQPANPLQVSKVVNNSVGANFQKNLIITDKHLLPGNEFEFKIDIKNVGTTELKNVQFKDVLPCSVDFLGFTQGSGKVDNGNCPTTNGTITGTIDKLSPNETKTLVLKVKIKEGKFLPANAVTCDPNLAEASVDGFVSQDTASFCYENQVLGSTQELPKTGPQQTLLVLFMSIATFLFASMMLQKERIFGR